MFTVISIFKRILDETDIIVLCGLANLHNCLGVFLGAIQKLSGQKSNNQGPDCSRPVQVIVAMSQPPGVP